MNAYVAAMANLDAKLLVLGEQFRKAWATERAAFIAADLADIGNSTPAIDAAHDQCSDLASKILKHKPTTLEGAKVTAMVWGWLHYLSAKPDEYEGGEQDTYIDERAAHAVMSFLLKDCAA